MGTLRACMLAILVAMMADSSGSASSEVKRERAWGKTHRCYHCMHTVKTAKVPTLTKIPHLSQTTRYGLNTVSPSAILNCDDAGEDACDDDYKI